MVVSSPQVNCLWQHLWHARVNNAGRNVAYNAVECIPLLSNSTKFCVLLCIPFSLLNSTVRILHFAEIIGPYVSTVTDASEAFLSFWLASSGEHESWASWGPMLDQRRQRQQQATGAPWTREHWHVCLRSTHGSLPNSGTSKDNCEPQKVEKYLSKRLWSLRTRNTHWGIKCK